MINFKNILIKLSTRKYRIVEIDEHDAYYRTPEGSNLIGKVGRINRMHVSVLDSDRWAGYFIIKGEKINPYFLSVKLEEVK